MTRRHALGAAILLATGCGARAGLDVSGATSSTTHATTSMGGGTTGTGAGTTGTGGGTTGTGGGPAPACTDAPLGMLGPEDVTGTMLVRHILQDGSTTLAPTDLSATPIHAFVRDGSTWTSFVGEGRADGTFTIPGVPEGPYVLDFQETTMPQVFDRLLNTSARVLALGHDALGRPDAVTSLGAVLQPELQNLDPWVQSPNCPLGENDLITFLGVNSNGIGGIVCLSPGVTKGGGIADWNGGLVDGTKGDLLYAMQLSVQMAPQPYRVITRFATFPGVDMAPSGGTPLNGALDAPPLTESLSVDLRASQFAALAPSVNPSATGLSTGFDVVTMPGASITNGYSADLISLNASAVDVSVGPLPYANPFPASWGTFVSIETSANLTIPVPGTSQPLAAGAPVYRAQRTLADATSAPVVPVLSPVQDPRVNGQSAFEPMTGISTTPVLIWQPPAIGKAAGYVVTVMEISGTAVSFRATLVTEDPALAMPPCLLTPGGTYYFMITAVMTTGSLLAYPYLTGAEWATADAVTSAFKP